MPESTQESSAIQNPFSESDEEANVDLLATETFEEGTESDIGYFGPSSNHVFFRSLSDLFARILTVSTTKWPTRGTALPLYTYIETIPGSVQSIATPKETPTFRTSSFPSHTEAMQLLEYYFSTIGQMIPFVDKSMALADLRKVEQEHQRRLSAKRALLSIIFALACASADLSKSIAFYNNALTCLGNDRLRGASLDLLQTFMLVVNYQQNHQMSIASWTYHALAVKTAFQLGLQSPPSYRRFGQHERELRLQIWYGLVNQDRILCMCLGRPCLIPSNYVQTPKLESMWNSVHNYVSAHIHDVQSHIYHSQLTSLHDIIGTTLSQMYHDNIDCDTPSRAQVSISTRLPIQWKLEDWRCHLNPHCHIMSDNEMTSEASMAEHDHFRLILSIHYYRAILMLNAPTLLALLRETLESTQNHDTGSLLEHAVPIVRYEFNALRDLHQIMSTILARGNLYIDQNNAWWLCNYTALTTAMHLFCLLLFCHNHSRFLASVGIVSADVRTTLDEALSNMIVVQRSSVMTQKAHKCLIKFVQLFDTIPVFQHGTPSSVETLSTMQHPAPVKFLDPTQYVARAASDFLGQYGFDDFLGDGIFYGTNNIM